MQRKKETKGETMFCVCCVFSFDRVFSYRDRDEPPVESPSVLKKLKGG